MQSKMIGSNHLLSLLLNLADRLLIWPVSCWKGASHFCDFNGGTVTHSLSCAVSTFRCNAISICKWWIAFSLYTDVRCSQMHVVFTCNIARHLFLSSLKRFLFTFVNRQCAFDTTCIFLSDDWSLASNLQQVSCVACTVPLTCCYQCEGNDATGELIVQLYLPYLLYMHRCECGLPFCCDAQCVGWMDSDSRLDFGFNLLQFHLHAVTA